jgi:hypothetical protein
VPVFPLTSDRRERITVALARIAGHAVRIEDEQHVGHEWAPVTRLHLDRELPGIGSSVIVKTRRVEGDGHGGPPYLRREAAGLETGIRAGVVPELIDFDDVTGVLIESDLGPWPTLQDQLLGDDPQVATAGLINFAASVGRLHATTLGRGESHQRILERSAADVLTGIAYFFDADHWARIERACDDHGLPPAGIARDEAEQLFARVFQPGSCSALIHLDLNPTNVLITDRGARLIDFEGCRIGHVGVDACFLHYPFPHHSNPWGVLPDEVVQRADAAYRSALAEGGATDVLDDYDRMLADGAAIPLIGRILRLPLIAGAEQSRHDSWRRRGQVVQQIATFTRLATRTDSMPVFTGWLRDLATAMVERWPDAVDPPAPLFPAYANGRR